MSALTKVIKKFIVLPKESWQENSASFQMKMANFYREQAVEHKFYTTTQKVKNIIANTPRKNTGTYYELFKTEELLHDHETLHYNKKKGTRIGSGLSGVWMNIIVQKKAYHDDYPVKFEAIYDL